MLLLPQFCAAQDFVRWVAECGAAFVRLRAKNDSEMSFVWFDMDRLLQDNEGAPAPLPPR